MERGEQSISISEVATGVHRALISSNTTTEIQQRVCKQFANAPFYDGAWIGEYNSATDTVVPQAATGITDDSLDSVQLNKETEHHIPLLRAIETQTVRTNTPLDDSNLSEEQRDSISDFKSQSHAVLPLVYDDALYGVLILHTDRPDAFDDTEYNMLADLAEVIGFALNDSERHSPDIEREQHQRDFRETQAQLEAVNTADSVGTWLWKIPEDNFITDASFARLFGVDPEQATVDVPLETILSGIHEDDRKQVEEKIDETVEAGGEYEAEYRVRNTDGDIRWIVARGNVEHDENGTPVRFPGVVSDITERKQAEEELRRTQEQLEIATKAASVGIWRWDIQENNLVADEYLAESYGIDPEKAAAGAPIEQFFASIHEEDRERIWQKLDEAVEETGKLEAEYRVRDGEGNTMWVVSRAEVEYDENGTPVRMNGAISDVTERKRTERRTQFLEKLGQELQPLADPDEIMATTAQLLGEHLNVDRCAYAEVEDDEDHFVITGDYAPGNTESIVGRWAFSDFGDETLRLMHENRTNVVDDVEADERVTKASCEAYKQIQAEAVICVPLYKAGKFVSAMAVNHRTPREWRPHEIELVETVVQRCWESLERARTVRDLREREEQLEQQNERLEGFASMLAHEIRNPVTIGQIYSQQLPDEVAPEAVDYVVEAFDRIEDMVDVMLVLTRGRKAVGGGNSVQLDEVVQEVWADMDAPDASLEVAIDYTIQADETYIRHLFRNLFENAVEHGGVDVTITVGELSTGLYVADDGQGIAADDWETVFDAGYTTAASQGGTGLGLAFVRELAEVYEWTCSVTESATGGARFEFRNVDQER